MTYRLEDDSTSVLIKHSYFSVRYACLFKEQLLELLSSSAVSNAVRRYEPKPPFSISGDMESNLSMIPDLPMAELDSIALVSWNKETGEVTGKKIFSPMRQGLRRTTRESVQVELCK